MDITFPVSSLGGVLGEVMVGFFICILARIFQEEETRGS
jgi:hypothetical protein